jgi:hypothetical protein
MMPLGRFSCRRFAANRRFYRWMPCPYALWRCFLPPKAGENSLIHAFALLVPRFNRGVHKRAFACGLSQRSALKVIEKLYAKQGFYPFTSVSDSSSLFLTSKIRLFSRADDRSASGIPAV